MKPWGWLAMGLLALLLGGCGDNVFRYKMTVEVDTPQGLKTGSSVWEVRYEEPGWFPFPFGESRPQKYFRGEAVAVDIAPGQTLFALKVGKGGDSEYGKFMPSEMMGWRQDSGVVEGPVELWPARDAEPMLVRFRDINDPTSVEQANPADLGASFGSGVALKRIVAEETNDPVTTGIEKRLKWLKNYYDNRLNGDRFENMRKHEISAHLSAGSFTSARLGESK